ncbi:hypothetical protein R6Q57_003302 [Mikania cordata]
MVFSSVPPYLDHNNWHLQLQQSSHQQTSVGGVSGDETPNISPSPVPPPLSHHGREGGGGASRPGSMVDRARMFNLPTPESGLNCPRCNSTNTKFCYYNNYNLTQPRYLCKTCRRYWTQGGALRTVPVGGGCRKNKRNNKKSSKSPNQTMPKSLNDSPSRCCAEAMTHTQLSHPPSLQLPSMSSLGQHIGVGGTISSNLGGFHLQNEMGSFQLGSGSSNGHNFHNISSIRGVEHWRLPFLAGFEVPNNPNLLDYQNEGVITEEPSSSMFRHDTQTPNSRIDNNHTDHPVKTENKCILNMSSHFVGVSEASNQQPWVGNAWTEFSGVISTSSTTLTTCFL